MDAVLMPFPHWGRNMPPDENNRQAAVFDENCPSDTFKAVSN